MAPNNTLHTPFGTVGLWMTPLTEGCDPKSRVIGNSRGVYVSAVASSMAAPSVLLRNPVRDVDREFTVVSGRGKFRMARGFCKLKCIFFNETNGSIVEYTVVVK
ncbi:PREDICTED: dirigent [Prunus dulcis]|uniref:Dirigent protein n=1 Tax=Prunus dulcis TaxID=3755 RepID=A0A5E4EJN7_PRUDU|nr:dirigent protein 4-like [Prunus dulcis]KAI5315042.1 hypothetical protein L3X38_044218 [Prunus dulcis]VVA15636.1 PREDICTED: dirigent [Prunus dulcis]